MRKTVMDKPTVGKKTEMQQMNGKDGKETNMMKKGGMAAKKGGAAKKKGCK